MVLTFAALLAQTEDATDVPARPDISEAAESPSIADTSADDDEAILTPARHADAQLQVDERMPPNYDGRDPDWSPSPLIWVPRVVLFPLYLVSEYGLRTPIGALTRWIDRDNVATRVREALTFRDHTIGIFPTFTIANGQQPGFGFYVWADRIFVDRHSMRLSVSTDFQHNIMSSFVNRFALSAGELNVRLAYQQRNDLLFYGLGPYTAKADRTRFERKKPIVDIELIGGAAQGASSRVSADPATGSFAINNPTLATALSHLGARLGVELSDNNFQCTARSPDICGADNVPHTADDRFTLDNNGEAAYFTTGFALLRVKALFSFDSRDPRRPSDTGLRFDVFGRYGEGMGDRAREVRFFRYGGELSGFVDVTGSKRRVLAARLFVEMLERVDNSDVPFTELINLGGFETMRGFLRARFQGESAAVASVEYRWPIWSFLDANLFYDMGNVFSEHLDNFELNKLRGSYGLAVRTNTSRDASFELLIAIGTKQWSASPDEFRIALGTNLGF